MGQIKQFVKTITGGIPPGHKYFSGIYHGGDAEYCYIPSENGHIFDGDFKFNIKVGHGMYRKAEGRFENNLKVGDWLFVRKNTDNMQQVSVPFSGGCVEGNLNFLSQEVTMLGIRETKLSLTISDGQIKGDIVGSFEGKDFVGFCDENGLPDGVWTLTFSEHDKITDIEKEIWDHGKLVDSTHEDLHWKKITPKAPNFVSRINYFIEYDFEKLKKIVGRGTVRTFQSISLNT